MVEILLELFETDFSVVAKSGCTLVADKNSKPAKLLQIRQCRGSLLCSGLSSIVVASLICTALCDIGNHNGLPAQLMVQMPVSLAVTPVSEPSAAFAASAVGAID